MWSRCLCILLSSLPLWAAGQCPTLVWSDEFEGESLDTTKWSYQIGNGCPELCGWGNNELQYYRPENATVGDGLLRIAAKRESIGGSGYTSSRLRTIDKGDWTYGRFEARIKLPTGPGLWPAFWMLPTDEVYGGWPKSGEIDIMEIIGSEPATLHGTIHYGQDWPNNSSSGASLELLQGTFNDDFHEFAVEWEPNEIRWYLDGYLYSRKTNLDVLPQRWPFNADFHILLNVAVGGNWPGAPNSSTTFPQEMVVDYVRVYEGNAAALEGAKTVAHQAKGVVYAVKHAPTDATFQWSVPEGATIVDGQGTSQITVDFGEASGDLQVEVATACADTRTLRVGVVVEEPYGRLLTLENFEDTPLVTLSTASGNLTAGADNPAPDDLNGSSRVGEYARNSSEQYDVILYQTAAIANGDDFPSAEKRFYMDVYTDAPTGTEILLQLENSNAAEPSNYPTGRHSRYRAVTNQQNAWERLQFELLDEPDPSVSGGAINQIALLFDPNNRDGSTYFFDNFEVFQRGLSTGLFTPPSLQDHLRVFPNPGLHDIRLQYEGESRLVWFELWDASGRLHQQAKLNLAKGDVAPLPVDDLPSGTYFLRGIDAKGAVGVTSFVKP